MKKVMVGMLVLLVMVGFLAVGERVSAQSSATQSPKLATAPAQVEYSLAYPGILPDNPLYFLKAARDKFVSFLISDNEKKAEFNLLTSDKRVNAAFILASKGKSKLALETLSKSNNYLEQAISNVAASQKEGRDVNSQLQNLGNSIHKHLDLTVGIKSKLGKKYSQGVLAEQKRLEKYAKSVKALIAK